MISEIRIQNFKSIEDLKLKLGRVTVLIGENGSGKTNILEAIGFAAAAAADKLDNEFLYNRGIRVVEEQWMRSGFSSISTKDPIHFELITTLGPAAFDIRPLPRPEDGSFNRWMTSYPLKSSESSLKSIELGDNDNKEIEEIISKLKVTARKGSKWSESIESQVRKAITKVLHERTLLRSSKESAIKDNFGDFVIYSPENSALRNLELDSAIEPLGIDGKGLFKLLQSFKLPDFKDRLTVLQEQLQLFGWFKDFQIAGPKDVKRIEHVGLRIQDRWLSPSALFDQRSANEGFLYALFYFALLISWRTPKFFAIENIDNALNPKLAAKLTRQIVELAKKYDKQVILTTHNPAVLDGLDLADDEQRLLTVRRDEEGRTYVNRVHAPQPLGNDKPVRLSLAFMQGLIGGLPENF